MASGITLTRANVELVISVHAFGHLIATAQTSCVVWGSPVTKILSSARVVNCNKTRPFFYVFPVAILDLGVGHSINCPVTFNSIVRDIWMEVLFLTRNTFCGAWYLPHNQFHNERTVPIIMAECIAHIRNSHISTS